MDLVSWGGESGSENTPENTPEENSGSITNETSGNVTPENFKMTTVTEETLDMYLKKIQDFYEKLDEEKDDIVTQKAKVLQAVLGIDMINKD